VVQNPLVRWRRRKEEPELRPGEPVVLEVDAGYSQFTLADEDAVLADFDAWRSDDEFSDGVSPQPGHLSLLTARHTGPVPVSLELVDAEPEVDLDEWQHAVESSLEVASGRLGIGFDQTEVFRVEPGTYAVLYLGRGLDTIRDHAATEGDDEYRTCSGAGTNAPCGC